MAGEDKRKPPGNTLRTIPSAAASRESQIWLPLLLLCTTFVLVSHQEAQAFPLKAESRFRGTVTSCRVCESPRSRTEHEREPYSG